MNCKTCDAPRVEGVNFCPKCKHVYDLKELQGVRIQSFTGRASLNSNVERFWKTGDPRGL